MRSVMIMCHTPVTLQSSYPHRVLSVTQTLLAIVFLCNLYVQLSLSFINTPVSFLPSCWPTGMHICAKPPTSIIDEDSSHNIPINTFTAHSVIMKHKDVCLTLCIDVGKEIYSVGPFSTIICLRVKDMQSFKQRREGTCVDLLPLETEWFLTPPSAVHLIHPFCLHLHMKLITVFL